MPPYAAPSHAENVLAALKGQQKGFQRVHPSILGLVALKHAAGQHAERVHGALVLAAGGLPAEKVLQATTSDEIDLSDVLSNDEQAESFVHFLYSGRWSGNDDLASKLGFASKLKEESLSFCHRCDLLFVSKEEYDAHKTLGCSRKFTCRICGSMFSRVQFLLDHLAEVRHGETICSICPDFEAQTPQQFEEHLAKHLAQVRSLLSISCIYTLCACSEGATLLLHLFGG